MKLSLDEIQAVLSEKVKDKNIINSIIKDLEKIVEEKKEDKEDSATPKRKNDFAIVVKLLPEMREMEQEEQMEVMAWQGRQVL